MNFINTLIARLTRPRPSITEAELDAKIEAIATEVFDRKIRTWGDR